MTVGFILPALRRGSPTDLTVRADRATLSDAAVEFDAADKALLKSASDPAFFTLAGKTVSLWVKLDDSADRLIFKQQNNLLFYDPPTDTFSFEYNLGEHIYVTSQIENLGHVDLTDWVHIVIVARSAGVKIYLNGILDTNDDSNIPVTGGDGNVYQFGGLRGVSWFDGKFDSSAIWNREFTDAEVLQLYNDGDGFTYSQLPANLATGIMHAWDFSARSSTGVWFDAVGGEHLTEEFGNKVTNGDFAVDTGWSVGHWGISGGKATYAAEMADYVSRVTTAGGNVLAYNSIVEYFSGLISAGIWDKVKASALFAGVDFNACLVPLRSDMPTPENFNFTITEHNTQTGLKGNASTMFINTKYGNNADGQNDAHRSVYATDLGSITTAYMAVSSFQDGIDALFYSSSGLFLTRSRSQTSNSQSIAVGFLATTRTSGSQYIGRADKTDATIDIASQSPFVGDLLLFARGSAGSTETLSDSRLATYTIGSGLTDTELAALDTLQTQLLADIATELA